MITEAIKENCIRQEVESVLNLMNDLYQSVRNLSEKIDIKMQQPLAQSGFVQRGFDWTGFDLFQYTQLNSGGYSLNRHTSWQHQLHKDCVNV